MLFKRFEAEGLAHYSYMIGDGNSAAVIDPQRDCDVYVEEASRHGLKITHIFETHRNEDYVTGSVELAALTDAEILHADAQLEYGFGRPVSDREVIKIGRLKVEAIHTPGHTPGHMSYLLYDTDQNPWIVFSGDALFAGDVGRTDFLGAQKLDEMTAKLYDSIFERLLPLGDHIILCPAHGSGSVCGAGISERQLTTLGMERRYNPKLQFTDKESFVKTGQMLDRSPYFLKMEQLNVEGPPILNGPPNVYPLSVAEFEQAIADGAVVLDTRKEIEYGASHIPGAVFVPNPAVPVYAGWFLGYDKPVLLVEDADAVQTLVRKLVRIGFDNIGGVLKEGMFSWQMSGKPLASIGMPAPIDVCDQVLDGADDIFLLDVRKPEEVKQGSAVEGALNISLTALVDRLNELPRDKDIYVLCGSGTRAMMGASLLKRNGFERVVVPLGGIKGLKAACPERF